ncbi:MAG: hypothetical protein J7K46_06410 [Bacteroidales bacterium]|nr:hypothetical protein [Bacteroidales bacterium]
MKKIMKKYLWFILALPLLLVSCAKESISPPGTYVEINGVPLQTNGDNNKIDIESNGIGIEFCLLNEAGEPATTFNRGENFKFHLAITNNIQSDTAMYIVSDFLRNPDLYMVYKENGDIVGKPVEWHGMDKISDGYALRNGEAWTLEIPWHEKRGTEMPFDYHNLIRVLQHFFIGLNRQPLSKGTYYTKFTQQYCLGRYLPHPQDKIICTDTLSLRIVFEIK